MANQNHPRPLRDVVIAERLWVSLDRMAAELGRDRDAVVEMALAMFARDSGFHIPEARGAAAAPPAPAQAASSTDDGAARRAVAKHVLDTAAEFERLLKNRKK